MIVRLLMMHCGVLLATGPALAGELVISSDALFSQLDGSAHDEDGVVDGVLTVAKFTINGADLFIDVPQARLLSAERVLIKQGGGIRADGLPQVGPELLIESGSDIHIGRGCDVVLDGLSRGGALQFCAQDVILIGSRALISASGLNVLGVGGSVRMTSQGKIDLHSSDAHVRVNGATGGQIDLRSCRSGEAVIIKRSVLEAAGSSGAGGHIDIVASQGSIELIGNAPLLRATGTPAGSIALTAATTIAMDPQLSDPEAVVQAQAPSDALCDDCTGGQDPDCLDGTDCDDANPCTDDLCVAGSCQNTPNTAACNDGVFCTLTDVCVDGQCVGAGDSCPGQLCDETLNACGECLTVEQCDDGNACTEDYCENTICIHLPAPDGNSCDDGSNCSTGDSCLNGVCVAGQPACPGQQCDPASGPCVDCLVDGDCADGNDCTDDSCTGGTCQNTPRQGPCEDGLFCTTGEACAAGVCAGGSPACPGQVCEESAARCVDCLVDSDCDDDNSCTDDACVANTCVLSAAVGACEDGLFCTANDSCLNGLCIGSPPACPGQLCDESGDACVDAPPAMPVLDPVASFTAEPTIDVSGAAPGAVTVTITGPAGAWSALVTNDLFTAVVPLVANRANDLFVTAIGPSGSASAPTTTQVIQDIQAPQVFIDFPADGQVLTATTSDVAGRVSDALSGFMGLTVTVNGVAAIVEPGIGTNGTFLATGVPLNTASSTLINAVAGDALDNTSQEAITVYQENIAAGSPRLILVSGNAQAGIVHGLLPAPIVVRAERGDGTPMANKVVTFQVRRSDGRLGAGSGLERAMFQVQTDSNGLAQALWRLGADAGCGNNRVEVTSNGLAGTATFCASATPGPAAQINIAGGAGQRVEAGTTAPQPLRVWVSDSCNGIAGVPVTFTVLTGGGTVGGAAEAIVNTSITGHAEVPFTLGTAPGNQRVSADFAGNAFPAAEFVINGLPRTAAPASFEGVVLDNASRPLAGATAVLRIGGLQVGTATSAADGSFMMTALPAVGAAELVIEAATISAVGGQPLAPGTYYPDLHFKTVIIPGVTNALSGPILLPQLNTGDQQTYDGQQTEDLILTCSAIDGLKMIVQAGTTITLSDGTQVGPGHPGTVAMSISQVHHDDVPMPMPDGAAPPFAWTLQPSGAQFDIPVRVEYPNMSGLAVGSISNFLSFDHDTDRFEIVCTGTVGPDGSTIVTDPGAGILKSGWGCNCPPYSVTGSCEKEEDEEEGSCPTLMLDQPLPPEVLLGDDLTMAYEVVPDEQGNGFSNVGLEIRNALGVVVFSSVALPQTPGVHEAVWPATRWNRSPHAGALANPANGPYIARLTGYRDTCLEFDEDAFLTHLIIDAELQDAPPEGATVSRTAGMHDLLGGLQVVLVLDQAELVLSPPDVDVVFNDTEHATATVIVDAAVLDALDDGSYQVLLRNLRDAIGNFADADGDPSNGIQPLGFPLELR